MIKTFKCKETEQLFQGRFSTKLPHAIQRTAVIKLKMLHAASVIESLRIPPANRLEAMKGARKGQYSIRANKQWRVCFVWRDGDAYNVEIVDYH